MFAVEKLVGILIIRFQHIIVSIVGSMDDRTKLISDFASSLRSKGRRPATIESYQRDARDFLEFLESTAVPLGLVDTEILGEYIAKLFLRERHNSIRRKIIGIRQFFRFISDINHEPDSPLDHYPIPARDESLPDDLRDDDIEEITGILLSQKQTLKSKRDLAIFYLLAFEGLKASELINLKWENLIFSQNTNSLHVFGSRGRTIIMEGSTALALKNYKTHLEKVLYPLPEDIFISFKGREAQTITPKISRHGLKFLVYELGDVSGIHHLNTELLRHYATSYQLSLGKSPAEVMAHFGLKRLGNIAKHINRRGDHAASLPSN